MSRKCCENVMSMARRIGIGPYERARWHEFYAPECRIRGGMLGFKGKMRSRTSALARGSSTPEWQVRRLAPWFFSLRAFRVLPENTMTMSSEARRRQEERYILLHGIGVI